MAQHNDIGQWGEKLAHDHLAALGYAMVENNVRIGHYEIDLVAMKGDRVVFIEVKTRSHDDDDPIDAIDRKKIAYLCRAADAFIQKKQWPHEVQFDVVCVKGSPDSTIPAVIEHFPDAFRPPLRTR